MEWLLGFVGLGGNGNIVVVEMGQLYDVFGFSWNWLQGFVR